MIILVQVKTMPSFELIVEKSKEYPQTEFKKQQVGKCIPYVSAKG